MMKFIDMTVLYCYYYFAVLVFLICLYLPYIYFFLLLYFQVIIQGLRESGVFSSIIASAPTTLSKDKFLSSIVSSNSTRATASESLPSRRIGRSKEHQATVRRVLEIESAAASYEAAVPPLSPPGMGDAHLIIAV
jgi:hypothetical protein